MKRRTAVGVFLTLNEALSPKSTSFTSASSAMDSKQMFSSLISRCCHGSTHNNDNAAKKQATGRSRRFIDVSHWLRLYHEMRQESLAGM